MTQVPESTTLSRVVKTPYDSSVSYLYKQAVLLEVPVRYVIIRPGPGDTGQMSFFVEVFDLDDHPNAIFTTIFRHIRELLVSNPTITLTQIWDDISQFQGDSFNPAELVQIWLHAIPEYRIDNPAVYAQIVVFLQSIGETTIYPQMEGFLNYYISTWFPRFTADLEMDRRTVEKFTRVQEQISQIAPLQHSPIELDSITVTYDLTFENNPLPDIFSSSFTSYVVPFIQYNIASVKELQSQSTEDRYYKVYKGRSVDAQPNYNNTIIQPSEASRAQTIYLNIWSGADSLTDPGTVNSVETQEDARIGKKEAFLLATIAYLPDTQTVRVTVNSPLNSDVNQNTMINRLHQHIPGLPRPPEKAVNENKITGSFSIYNADVLDEAFLHLVMNDPLFSSYLYVEEAQKAFAVKQRLIIHYRGAIADKTSIGDSDGKSRAAVSATINQDRIPVGETAVVNTAQGPVTRRVNEPQGMLIVTVKMTKASSRRVAEQFVNILSRLFKIYSERGRTIIQEYLQFIPEYQLILNQKVAEMTATQPGEAPSTLEGDQIVSNANESRITRLRAYAGDVFVANYARQCQRPLQPIPVRADEIPAWQHRTFTNRSGFVEERQVLPFPPVQSKYYFVCPSDDAPYPGVKENKTLNNRHIYPFIPCCFGMNQLGRDTKLTRYYSGNTGDFVGTRKSGSTAKSSHEIVTDKICPPDRTGLVASNVANFLRKYSDDQGEIRRLGVPRSTNSFIHCVAIAVSDPGYYQSQDKEAYVSLLRSRLIYQNSQNPGLGVRAELLRQELFDMTNEDIITLAGNEDEFFDPLMFYRAMEVLFNCNIYVFALNDKDRKTGQETSLLQLPRNKYFHVHPPNTGRPVVLIVRHLGSESNSLDYPQCELIIDRVSADPITGVGIRKLFDESMNELLYPAITFVGRTITWQVLDTGRTQAGGILTARQNVYSAMNYQQIFGQIVINGQVIDGSGKARMFSLRPLRNNNGGYDPLTIYVSIPPTAPLNVPEIRPEDISQNLPSYERTTELFGNPVNATTTPDGTQLTGLWFSAGDIQFAFYCPCADYPITEFRTKYPDLGQTGRSDLAALTVSIPRNGQNPGSGSSLDRIRTFRRSASFINQIVQYLYLKAGRPKGINEFLATIAGMLDSTAKTTTDSAVLYSMSTLQRILPDGDDPQTILTALSAQVPRVFPSNRLVMYDQEMYFGVRYNLLKWAQSIEGLQIDISDYRELRGYYMSKHDFSVGPREFILSGLTEYNQWTSVYVPSPNLQQRSIQNLKDNIQTQLNPNAFAYQEPYIYQRSGNTTIGTSLDPRQDRFYLIQNVAGGDFQRATQVALSWYLEKRNTGFGTEPYVGDTTYAFVTYRINQGGGTIVENSQTNGQTRYLEILNYGNNLFAAMLPILSL